MDIQQVLVAEYEQETAKTRRMLAAIPADADFNYKPHEKSMSLGRLSGHVAETAGEWAIHTLTQDVMEFPGMENYKPYLVTDAAQLLERFDREVAEAKTALAAMTPEKWDSHWKFVSGGQTWIDNTKYRVFREWVLDHLIHHRAQLGVYLRLLDKPIPGTFGPSADGM
ncbi:MAG: DinB family protein [Terracidiphilus sp.]